MSHNNNDKRHMQSYKVAKAVGYYDSGTGKYQSNTVYSSRYCIPTTTTIMGGTQQIKVLRAWRNGS